MKHFEIDTTAVPDDALSEKIRELRKLKAGFNINEAIAYKMAEARSRKRTYRNGIRPDKRLYRNR